MSLVDFVQRVAGAVGGAAAALLKTRKTIYFDPEHFDVSDDATTRVNGSATDPGVETGFTKIRITEGAFPDGGVPDSRQVIAGAGLTGGGALSSNVTLNVVSPGGTLTVGANSVEVTTPVEYSEDDPEAITAGVGDPGDTDEVARANHVHPHGDLEGGSLHALVGAGVDPGFMDPADKTKLDAATENATASTLVLRGSDGVLRQIKTSVGTSVVVGAEIENTTAAVAGPSNQYSPALVLTGNGWTGAASHEGNWALQGRPTGAASSLVFASQINGGGYTVRLTLDSAGGLALTGDFQHPSGAKFGAFGTAAITRPSAYTQTYSTADKTLAAWTPDTESTPYTGIATDVGGTPYATVDDLNQLRVAYENLRVTHEDLMQFVNAMLDDLQALGLLE